MKAFLSTFPIPKSRAFELEVPKGAKILGVYIEEGLGGGPRVIELTAAEGASDATEQRGFLLLRSNESFEGDLAKLRYIGSFFLGQAHHLFEVVDG